MGVAAAAAAAADVTAADAAAAVAAGAAATAAVAACGKSHFFWFVCRPLQGRSNFTGSKGCCIYCGA